MLELVKLPPPRGEEERPATSDDDDDCDVHGDYDDDDDDDYDDDGFDDHEDYEYDDYDGCFHQKRGGAEKIRDACKNDYFVNTLNILVLLLGR